ncbi:hypothetical protein PV325_009662 [Microctonus aethiopoides]|nr:hypothetical protein PV325_009662 [Microctonus aethiopoides]
MASDKFMLFQGGRCNGGEEWSDGEGVMMEKVPWWREVMVEKMSWWKGVMVERCHGGKESWWKGVMVERFHRGKESWWKGVMVERSHGGEGVMVEKESWWRWCHGGDGVMVERRGVTERGVSGGEERGVTGMRS